MSFPSEFRVRLPASCFFLLLPLKRSKENEAIYQEVGVEGEREKDVSIAE